MEFVASKFNEETDEDRPKIGEEFNHIDGGETHIIGKVSHILLNDIVSGGVEPDKGEFDVVLIKGHTTRPAVYWVVWGNKKNN